MAPTITTLTNTDRAFYTTLGPFLARREVHKALGGVPWDEDAKTWFVAKKGRAVVGFAAVSLRGRYYLESLYTVPGHEQVDRALVENAVAVYGDHDLHTTVARPHVGAYRENGFAMREETKNFVTLARAASPAA